MINHTTIHRIALGVAVVFSVGALVACQSGDGPQSAASATGPTATPSVSASAKPSTEATASVEPAAVVNAAIQKTLTSPNSYEITSTWAGSTDTVVHCNKVLVNRPGQQIFTNYLYEMSFYDPQLPLVSQPMDCELSKDSWRGATEWTGHYFTSTRYFDWDGTTASKAQEILVPFTTTNFTAVERWLTGIGEMQRDVQDATSVTAVPGQTDTYLATLPMAVNSAGACSTATAMDCSVTVPPNLITFKLTPDGMLDSISYAYSDRDAANALSMQTDKNLGDNGEPMTRGLTYESEWRFTSYNSIPAIPIPAENAYVATDFTGGSSDKNRSITPAELCGSDGIIGVDRCQNYMDYLGLK